jgi:hypothetical protein
MGLHNEEDDDDNSTQGYQYRYGYEGIQLTIELTFVLVKKKVGTSRK